jgi:hypothetical protein
MDINVKVTIGLAQNVQDLAQDLIERLIRPAELPARSTVSNEIPTVAVARTPEVVSEPQPKQEVEQTEQEAEPGQEQPQEQCEEVSIDKVRERVAEVVTQGKRSQVVEILQSFGVTGFSQLKGEDLTEFYQKIKEL